MEKHPQITLQRIGRFLDELRPRWWAETCALDVAMAPSTARIPYAEAAAQPYAPIVPGHHAWGPDWRTAWFRVVGAIPAAWAGAEVVALIDPGAEGLAWHAGAPLHGVDSMNGDGIRAIWLDGFAPGPLELLVEVNGYPLHRSRDLPDETPYVFRSATLARLDRPAWDLWHDLSVLYQIARDLPEDSSRRANLIYAMNAAVNAGRRGGPDAMAEARACLAPELGRPADSSAHTATCLGHAHIDVAWKWPIWEARRKCARTFSSMLAAMARYPEFRFTQSQPQLYAYVKQDYPELYARIKDAVAAGQWEPEGAMWVEADCNIPSGESLVRQVTHGCRFFREEFGVEQSVLWLPDVFGYSAALPQIMAGCGIPYFLTQKISWNQFNTLPHHTFWWQGIDGTRVLAHFPPADTYNGPATPASLRKGERQFRDKDRVDSWLYLYGHGDGGGGVTPHMLESLRRSRDLEGLPRTTPGTAREGFDRMAAESRDLCTWVGELYLEYHRGTYTTQGQVKRENRRCETLLHEAELLASVTAKQIAYPAADIDEAWKLTLLNQFHDIIPGSSIRWVYEDAAQDYARVHAITEGVIEARLDALAGQLHTADLRSPALIWNSLSFARSGVVRLPWSDDDSDVEAAITPNGQVTRVQRAIESGEPCLLVEVTDVPSMGYVTVDLREDAPGPPAIADEVCAEARVLENGLVRLELNDRGEVVSYLDKTVDRELIPAGEAANVFQRFDDRPIKYDAWDIDPFYAEVMETVATPATITIVERGPIRAALRIARALSGTSTLVQEVRLEANSRRVDFVTHIDWHETDVLLKVAFPVTIHSPEATFEIQYGHVRRPTHSNTSWDAARFEVPAQKWMDLSESDYGVAVLNDGKYGCDVHGHTMRLSLLRAPKWPDPEADMGAHDFTYSLLPHRGPLESSGVVLAGLDLNMPLRARRAEVRHGALALAHSFFRLDVPNLVITAVKQADDGDGLIVRLYDAFRRRGQARMSINGLASRATRTDMREQDGEDLPVHGGTVGLEYRPFEILTVRLR